MRPLVILSMMIPNWRWRTQGFATCVIVVIISFLLQAWTCDSFTFFDAIRTNKCGLVGRRKPVLIWAVVPRTQYNRSTLSTSNQSIRPRMAPNNNKRIQLRWISQSLQNLEAPEDIWMAMEELVKAQTQDQVVQVGRALHVACDRNLTLAVRERVVKAAAMTGLTKLAIIMLNDMMERNEMPSEVAQDAVCSCLRKLGRTSELEVTLQQLVNLARNQSTSISLASFNILLAALCDVATGKDSTPKHPGKGKAQFLDDAATWLTSDPDHVRVQPDAVSYATVLQAAAAEDNAVLVNRLWSRMEDAGIRPNAIAYNARLRALADPKNDQERLNIWSEMNNDPAARPDRYTIDLMLLPFIRMKRFDELRSVIDTFVGTNSGSLVSNTLSSFLLTLIRGGYLSYARELFDTYMLPTLLPLVVGEAGSLRLVKADVRHCNILLGGYARQMQEALERSKPGSEKPELAIYEDAWGLYSMMRRNKDVLPDAYTIATMTSLCRESSELTQLILEATREGGIAIENAVLRAGITAYGRLHELAKACGLYAAFADKRFDTRTWNALLGALQEDLHHQISMLNLFETNWKDVLTPRRNSEATFSYFHGKSPSAIMQEVLEHYVSNSSSLTLPPPNSQTFCLLASYVQRRNPSNARPDSDTAMAIFYAAKRAHVPADGRLLNAVIRCFGNDVDLALKLWREELRPACLNHERRQGSITPLSTPSTSGKNLLACYHGLLYVAGRALRPDVALRLVYAMAKEGLNQDETALNCYRSGTSTRKRLLGDSSDSSGFAQKISVPTYESLLYVECMKYDQSDRRRAGERRVRIIV